MQNDINKQDEFGWTALMFACYEGNFEEAKLLLENGADVNLKNNNGHTALMWTCCKGKFDIVKLLLEKGADVNLKNNYSWTALILACFYGKFDIVKLLLENGADINLKNNDGETALIWAEERNYPEIVKLLKEHINKDTEPQYTKGRDALIEAFKESDIEKVVRLLKDGAYMTPQDIHYSTLFAKVSNITQGAIISLISDASDNIVNNVKNMQNDIETHIKNGTLRIAEQPFTLEINGITMIVPKEVLTKAVIDYLQKTN